MVPAAPHAGNSADDGARDRHDLREGVSGARRPLAFLTYDDLTGLIVGIADALYRTPEDGVHLLTVKGEDGRRLLEMSLANPQWDCHVDVASRAAGLFWSLIQNHGLNDGNKRLAIAATQFFLFANGYLLMLPSARFFPLALAVARGEMDREQVGLVFRQSLMDLSLPVEEQAQQTLDRWAGLTLEELEQVAIVERALVDAFMQAVKDHVKRWEALRSLE